MIEDLKIEVRGEPVVTFRARGLNFIGGDGVYTDGEKVSISLPCAENADQDLKKVFDKAFSLFESVSGKKIDYGNDVYNLYPNSFWMVKISDK